MGGCIHIKGRYDEGMCEGAVSRNVCVIESPAEARATLMLLWQLQLQQASLERRPPGEGVSSQLAPCCPP